MKNKFKFFVTILGPIGFIMLGINLIMKEDKMAITVGYVSIFFWSALLLFGLFKQTKK
jgi:hypothetical protein